MCVNIYTYIHIYVSLYIYRYRLVFSPPPYVFPQSLRDLLAVVPGLRLEPHGARLLVSRYI